MPQIKKIPILGGGFGGINVLKSIQNKFKKESNVRISIVSQDNYFLYTPMLAKRFLVATSWTADLLFKRDLTFVGKIKRKSLTKVNLKFDSLSIKDLFKDL